MTKWKAWVYGAIAELVGEKVAGLIVRFAGIVIVIMILIMIWSYFKPN